MENETQEYGIEAIAYEELQQQFQQVLANLSSDQTLDRFRVEYERIHKALKHSREQQKQLLGKCREISKDIVGISTQLQAVLRFSNDDSHKISFLKAEVTKIYKHLQNSKEQEELAKHKIDKLKVEMRNLNAQMERNDQESSGQVASVHWYTLAKEELEKEKEILQLTLDSNKSELHQIKAKIQASQKIKDNLEAEFQQCMRRKTTQEAKVKEEEENKKIKKQQLEVIKIEFDKAKADQAASKDKRKEINLKFKELTTQFYDLEIAIQKDKKAIRKVEKDQATEKKKTEQVEQINRNLKSLMQLKHKQLNNIQELVEKELNKQQELTSVGNNIKEQTLKVKAEKDQLLKIIDTVNSGLTQLQNQINLQKKGSGKDRSFIDKLKRERDMYIKQLERAEISNKSIQEQVFGREKVVKEKKNELFGQKKQIQKLSKEITALEKERDANSVLATSAQAKYYFSRDEVNLRDNFIAQFQKQNIQTEAKLKKQQALYQAVRVDRSLVSKKLAQTLEQKVEYLSRCKRVMHQITQLREQIEAKEKELVNEHTEHNKKDKKIQDEDKKIKKFQKDIQEKESKVKNFLLQKNKLQTIIKEIESQKQKSQDEFEKAVSERDILGTQLIRRSAEAELLYEKIKISDSFLEKGEKQYREKVIEIYARKNEIANLMGEIKASKTQNSALIDLKAEIHQLQRQLTDSKLKVKALSQEIQNPMNIHRWRKLQATDSATFELMTKIQSIQKRLIMKTHEVEQKEKQLNQKEQQLKSLQEVLKRQPSMQEEKMLPAYKESLEQKDSQIEAMKQQITAHQSEMEEYAIQLSRLQKELQNYKSKFFLQKKKDMQNKDQRKQEQQYIKVILPDKRFTGGGFNLAI